MSEELRLLLQMKRTSKFILLLMGFVAGSCILQLAVITGKFDLNNVHEYVDRRLPHVYGDTLWPAFKSALTVDGRPSTVDRPNTTVEQ